MAISNVNDNDRVKPNKGTQVGKPGAVTSLNVLLDGETATRRYDFLSLDKLTVTPPPVDPPTPPPTDQTSYGGFSAQNPPPGSWRPYATNSPFNTPIPADVGVLSNSAQLVAKAFANSPVANLTAGVSGSYDWGHPVYYAKTTDLKVRLQATQPWGTNPVTGIQIPYPAGAKPAGGTDHHITIITPDGWEYDLWEAQLPVNGVLNFGWGGRCRIDGDGGCNPGGTAANFAHFAGVLRSRELMARKIEHALFIVLHNTGNTFVYPATHTDGRTADGVPEGTRFQLNMTDAEINAMNAPGPKKTVLKALAKYGGYVGDTTSGNLFGFQLESAQSYASYGLTDPLIAWFKSNGVSTGVLNMAGGWESKLRAVKPPVK